MNLAMEVGPQLTGHCIHLTTKSICHLISITKPLAMV